MTSPRQRKKIAAFLAKKQKLEQSVKVATVEKIEPKLETPPPPVVESGSVAKLKKLKFGLVELKSQDQVIEQPKEEVKTSTGE